MLMGDIKREFFEVLRGRILIMCALDVDAICACRILQSLLESYNLQYSVAPVSSLDNFTKSFEEYRNSVDTIITINFGNLINLVRVLKPPENLTFYVIDSHRPINVYNYYKNPQVKVLIHRDEDSIGPRVPRKNKIFLSEGGDQDDEAAEAADLALLTANVRDLSGPELERRRELRRWLAKKQELMFDYEENHFYNRSVAVIMYDLANYLSKNNNYLLWLAIVGLTYQLKSEKIDAGFFEREADMIMRHKARNEVSSSYARGNKWRIVWQKDVQIELYRRWNVYESLCHTPLTVCSFKLWNDKGTRDFHEFLVECGLKLSECKTPYVAMSVDFRKDLVDTIQDVCLGPLQDKYHLQDLVMSTFVVHTMKTLTQEFKNHFCANDFVLSIRALLESDDPNLKITEKFVRAIQSLSYDDSEFIALQKGFAAAQQQMRSMYVLVKALITNLKVEDKGVFLYVDLQDQANVSRDFARGDSLMAFARFLLDAYVSSKSSRLARRALQLPLILTSPDYHSEDEILMVGIPPLAQSAKKNFFGKAFEQAAGAIDCEIKADLSETNLIRTQAVNKGPIFEQLKILLS